jgi:hypothetical protein
MVMHVRFGFLKAIVPLMTDFCCHLLMFVKTRVRALHSLVSIELPRSLVLKLHLAKRCGCPLQSVRIYDINRGRLLVLVVVLTLGLELIVLLLVLILLVLLLLPPTVPKDVDTSCIG